MTTSSNRRTPGELVQLGSDHIDPIDPSYTRSNGEKLSEIVRDPKFIPALAGVGLFAATAVFAGGNVLNSPLPQPESISDNEFDTKIQQAITNGPGNQADVIGTFPVGDSTVTVSMAKKIAELGYPTSDDTQLRVTTVSANSFATKPYDALSEYTLFENDFDGDGEPEVVGIRN